MRLALLGATGPTGQQILDQALEAGHRVTVLVRDPARLPQRDHPDITVVTGDATSTDDLTHALAGSDVVLSALGPGKDFKSTLAGHATRALIPAARAAGIDRVVMLSALGAGDTMRYTGVVPKTVIKLMMSRLFADKAEADALLRSSGLDWTLVYPAILTNGSLTGTYTAQEAPRRRVSSRISRADVADFMLKQTDSREWSRRDAILDR
ncbi:NAD(P)-dependent oxidoreductase [Streptomyces sp. NPDC057690]|uniref:NAD(P)-dependent oxidoreductase n=1 Tax=Streptomyces sp. NPDC057690 TaxID=3346214 RepID=UPI0036835BDC